MAKLELSRDLSLPQDRAWEHASDLAALGDWLSLHQGWRCELPDELAVGTTLVGVAGAKGMRNRVTWTIREFDPPRLLELTGKGVGGTKYGLSLAIAPAAAGSRFTLRLDMGGAPLFGPIGATAARAVKGDIEDSVKRFEALYA
ncbi:SRPBCC family protein [Mycobacterium sp. M1]|uniref:SRPBCC family protein n=1 Tax=Mycolicibacter acidiphilus TaxID=2835306 RepID=A0ABS5RMW0_9MYCO|nr:SRPBCC family protein [Mycolicibacter acidiphilus]MBS9534816.1 SRPBCC family protein [Mycolicibacter acidiphilus]